MLSSGGIQSVGKAQIQFRQRPESEGVNGGWGWFWAISKVSAGHKKSQMGQRGVETSEKIL